MKLRYRPEALMSAWRCGRAYSQDLRDRVFSADGVGSGKVAGRYGVSPSLAPPCLGRSHATDMGRSLVPADTIEFYLSPTRNTAAAKRFLGKALNGLKRPHIINTDKAPTYGAAIAELTKEGKCPEDTVHRQAK